jgi:hypothetical protein
VWNLRRGRLDEVRLENPRKFTMRQLQTFHSQGRLVVGAGGREVHLLFDDRHPQVLSGERRERAGERSFAE